MRQIPVRIALRWSLASVGLRRVPIPKIFESKGYQKPSGDESALHVVIEPGRIVVHEYSFDYPHSHYWREYTSLESFVRAFVANKIDNACTIYMATARMDTLEKVKRGNFEDFVSVRRQLKQTFVNRLERFLNGQRFALLRGLVQLGESQDVPSNN